MKKDSAIDYLACILFRLFGSLIRMLPINTAFFLGRKIGEVLYCLDLKHKAIAYANLKTAFGATLGPRRLSALSKQFYRSFGENFIEIFLLPLIDKEYIDKYVTIVGREHVREGLKQGKGMIFLVVHAGSWELSNIVGAYLGLDFNFFFRQQRFPRLGRLLNSYRSRGGGKIIQRQGQLRQLIEAIRAGQAIGMTADQGGKNGIAVRFFSKTASMSPGAIRLALKYDATLLPAFFVRTKGPYVKVVIEPPFEIRKSQDPGKDIRDNLQRVTQLFEKYISEHPHEYLWSYKIWKYTREKNILILSDAKTGHLRQSQALAKTVLNYLKGKGFDAGVKTIEVLFNNWWASSALTLSSCLSGKYHCQGCLWCLRKFLQEKSYKDLVSIKPDVVISCGARIAPVNYILSRENLAKSLVIMRPALLSTRRFDLVVMARHDQPPKRRNVVQIEGALNLVDDDYLKSGLAGIRPQVKLGNNLTVGLFFGGDTKNFRLTTGLAKKVIGQIKQALQAMDADILITTSRRTGAEIEALIKKEFQQYPRCKTLIIANEKNIPQAVGGILAASGILVVSPESISMISEAANSRKYVIVFDALGLDQKHRDFLNNFARNKYLYLVRPEVLSKTMQDIWSSRPTIKVPQDTTLVEQALERAL